MGMWLLDKKREADGRDLNDLPLSTRYVKD